MPIICTPCTEVIPSIANRLVNRGELFLFVTTFAFLVTPSEIEVVSFLSFHTGANKKHEVFQVVGAAQCCFWVTHLESSKISTAMTPRNIQ